jgi:hypothetical protein
VKHGLATPENAWVEAEPVFFDQAELHEGSSYLGSRDTPVFARVLDSFILVASSAMFHLTSLEFHLRAIIPSV